MFAAERIMFAVWHEAYTHGVAKFRVIGARRTRGDRRVTWTLNGNRASKKDCLRWVERDIEAAA